MLVAVSLGALPSVGLAGTLTLTGAVGFDSNPSRTVGAAVPPDGFLGVSVSEKGRQSLGESTGLQARYDLGVRKYFSQEAEDLLVQQGEVGLSQRVGPLLLGAEASGKLRLSRAGNRDYSDAGLEVSADWTAARWLSVRLAGAARGFLYLPEADYDSLGPRGVLSVRVQPARRHVVTAAAFAGMPWYRAQARYDSTGVLSPDTRRDRHLGAQISYSFRGPVALQGGYTYLRVDSNSHGEGSERHRVWAAASAKLPWRLFVGGQFAWQYLRYPDGVFLSEDLLLLDDESQSSGGVKLAFAATASLDVELRWSAFWIDLPPARDSAEASSTTWWRHTGTIGATARF